MKDTLMKYVAKSNSSLTWIDVSWKSLNDEIKQDVLKTNHSIFMIHDAFEKDDTTKSYQF